MGDNSETDEFTVNNYSMTKKRLGNVYIFNHVTFDNDSLGTRYGSMRDCKDIEIIFQSLNFDVTIYKDLSYAEILAETSNLSEKDYSNLDCLVIFVLSHGNNGKIFARDTDYYPDVYWRTLNKNTTLTLKPKMIFIQATRGDEADDGDRITSVLQTGASEPTTYSIPNVPDVLLVYSSYDGFYSWRSSLTGSWFVQGLCKELKLRAKNTDILTLLTFLNRRLAMYYINVVPDNKIVNVRRQIITVVSTLTRLLYICPTLEEKTPA